MITDNELRETNKDESMPTLTPLEFLLNCAYNNESLNQFAHAAFEFFIHEPITFWYENKAIIVGELNENTTLDELRLLTEENYFDFQNALRVAMGGEALKPPEPENPNEDPRIKRMKALARKRDLAKAKQALSKGGVELSESLVAICCMGIGITPLTIGEMSYAAVGALMNKSQLKEKYELDIQSLLAGADSKKIKPKYWIREKE